MKKIRNLLTVLLALVLVLTMAACGEKDPMLGKYMLVDAADMLGEPMEIDGEYMVLEKDGKGTMYTYGMTSDIPGLTKASANISPPTRKSWNIWAA